MSESQLFSTFNLKNFKLKNRIGVAPMTRMSSSKDGVPRRDVLDFLIRRAQNDVALIYTEAILTDYESAQGYPGQSRMVTQKQIDAWKPIVAAIKKEGAVAIMQMFHCGRVSWPEINPANRVIAPSPLAVNEQNGLTGEPYSIPEEMSLFDIEHVIKGFAETAKGAVAAGFDGVEIHGAHGYLISQFLSSYSNKRRDEYGGSAKNRYRFLHEVIKRVKLVVPDDRLLTVRVSDWGITEMNVSLFGTKEEFQEVIGYLSEEPIDAISLSTYEFDKDAFGTGKTMAGLAREASHLPIMICGAIYDRQTAERALTDADIVLSGKSLLLDPEWVKHIREEKPLKRYKSSEANIAYTTEPLP